MCFCLYRGSRPYKAINTGIAHMLNTENFAIYFYTEPVDMQKSIDSLCMLIADVLKMNPTEGAIYFYSAANQLIN